MKLHTKARNFISAALFVVLGLTFATLFTRERVAVFADSQSEEGIAHFVTIYDGDNQLTVKTTASTVAEVLERANIDIEPVDLVEPALETKVEGENYNVNVHRARPAVVIDGDTRKYVMSASFDPKEVAREAGIPVYDGDEIATVNNENFLETGVASTYQITRNGGRTVTEEESIPYTVEEKLDVTKPKGEREVERPGEDGRKVKVYQVNFENNVEVNRELVSEEVKKEPVTEVVLVGAKPSIAPGQETCVNWARQAGVPEADMEAAMYIIYHESGCRVDARNASSGAYGIPQALPGGKMASAGADWETNPVTQIRWMNGYVTSRYGGWQQALSFKMSHGWY